jgi:hypothetical protein
MAAEAAALARRVEEAEIASFTSELRAIAWVPVHVLPPTPLLPWANLGLAPAGAAAPAQDARAALARFAAAPPLVARPGAVRAADEALLVSACAPELRLLCARVEPLVAAVAALADGVAPGPSDEGCSSEEGAAASDAAESLRARAASALGADARLSDALRAFFGWSGGAAAERGASGSARPSSSLPAPLLARQLAALAAHHSAVAGAAGTGAAPRAAPLLALRAWLAADVARLYAALAGGFRAAQAALEEASVPRAVPPPGGAAAPFAAEEAAAAGDAAAQRRTAAARALDGVRATLGPRIAWIWVGSAGAPADGEGAPVGFAPAAAVAFAAPLDARPFLFASPPELLPFTDLLRALGVRESFGASDFAAALRRIAGEARPAAAPPAAPAAGAPEPAAPRALSPRRLDLAIALVQRLSDCVGSGARPADLEVLVPDAEGILAPAHECV